MDSLKLRTAFDKLSVDVLTSSNITKSSLLQLVTLFSALLIKPLIAKATAGSASDPHSSAHATSSIVLILFNLIWLWPLAGVATYYSGLLRPAQETDRRGGRNAAATGGGSDAKGIVARVVTEVSGALPLGRPAFGNTASTLCSATARSFWPTTSPSCTSSALSPS
jgi:hypothetical protein